MKKRLLLMAMTAAGCLSISQTMAQTDMGVLIQGGADDANKLMNAYAGPLMKSFGVGLNGGWFNTAKPHGIGGFDVTISVNAPFAPSSDQSYDPSSLGFKSLQLTTPSAANAKNAPTFFGEKSDGPEVGLVVENPRYTFAAKSGIPGATTGIPKDTMVSKFNLPQGIGVNFFAVPTAQFSIGIGFGTEIGIRFIPTQNTKDFSVGLWGFAIKHDFKQWIPVMKEMPFDLSAMFGYTTMSADVKFADDKAILPDPNAYNPEPSTDYGSQQVAFKSSAWTVNVLVSKKLAFITPYMGLGFQHAGTTLAMEGNYPVTGPNTNYDPTKVGAKYNKETMIVNVPDPFTIKGTVNSPRATFGLRMKILILTIHGDYTFSAYNMATVGVGVNLQSIVPFKL